MRKSKQQMRVMVQKLNHLKVISQSYPFLFVKSVKRFMFLETKYRFDQVLFSFIRMFIFVLHSMKCLF